MVIAYTWLCKTERYLWKSVSLNMQHVVKEYVDKILTLYVHILKISLCCFAYFAQSCLGRASAWTTCDEILIQFFTNYRQCDNNTKKQTIR